MYKVKKFLVIISLIFFLNPNYVLSDTKNDVEKECKELGFKENTPEIAQCKLEMMILSKKMNLENKKQGSSAAI